MRPKDVAKSGRNSRKFIVIESRREKREIREKRVSKSGRGRAAILPLAPTGPEAIQVFGLLDQDGGKWIQVTRGQASAIARIASIDDHRGSIWRELADQGLLLTRSKSKQAILNEIEDIRAWPATIYVANRSGYHCGAIVKPDGTPIGEPQVEHFRVALDGPALPLSRSGTISAWKGMVRTFAQGQVIYTTLLCASFVGPILELFPAADNVCLFIVGDTSGGKTTGLDLYCSVWGAPHSKPGSIGISLRSTSAGLERQMMARSAAAFAADEVNLLGRNTQEQGERVYDLAFMVSHGVEKERFGEAARPPVRQSFLATANTSLARLLEGQDAANSEAVTARFLTLPAEAGAGLGAFDTLPNGFADSRNAADALKDALFQHHGVAADAFLSKLADARRNDEAALKARLERYRSRFMRLIDLDPLDRAGGRRAKSFSLIYAAGRLAREWGILPLKGIQSLLLECHRRSAAADATSASSARRSARERLDAYVVANLSELDDLDAGKPAHMTQAELNRHPGFLRTIHRRRHLCIRRERWAEEFGSASHRMLKELQAEGCLVATDGLQTQIKVRGNSDKDRVYCLQLDEPR